MNNMNQDVRCAIYCRVAMDVKGAKEHNSMEHQEKLCRMRMANDLGDNVPVEIFRDGGASGESIEGRPALGLLISQVEAGNFDRVYVSTLCRLTRDTMEGLYIITEVFKKANVLLVTVNNGIIHSNDSASFLPMALNLIVRQRELETIKHRVRNAIYSRIVEGNIQGSVPYGYKVVNQAVVIDKREAVIVREVYQRYDDGESLRTIVQDLRRRGVKNRTRVNGSGKRPETSTVGSFFNRKMLIRMLSDRIYVGHVRTALHERLKPISGTPVHEKAGYASFKAKHPPLISEVQWNRVQLTILEIL